MYGFASVTSNASQSPDREIQEVIQRFVSGADAQSVSEIKKALDPGFRVVFNNYAKNEVSLIDLNTYLGFIERKEWGGDKRKVKIEKILVYDEHNATVKVYLDGEKADFMSFFSLIKKEGKWYIVQDLVVAKFG